MHRDVGPGGLTALCTMRIEGFWIGGNPERDKIINLAILRRQCNYRGLSITNTIANIYVYSRVKHIRLFTGRIQRDT